MHDINHPITANTRKTEYLRVYMALDDKIKGGRYVSEVTEHFLSTIRGVLSPPFFLPEPFSVFQ